MEKAYSALMGGYKATQSDQYTHVVLTKEEYQELKELKEKYQELKEENQKLKEENQELSSKIKYFHDLYEQEHAARNRDVAHLKQRRKEDFEEAKQHMYDWKVAYEKLEANANQLKNDLEQANALNINLKRICREKANAKRGLRPKKRHSGFILIHTGEYSEKILQDIYYKSIIETPYSTLMSLDQIKANAWNDGLCEFFDTYGDIVKNSNCLIKTNFRTGKNDLWQVVCWHTQPIDLKHME